MGKLRASSRTLRLILKCNSSIELMETLMEILLMKKEQS